MLSVAYNVSMRQQWPSEQQRLGEAVQCSNPGNNTTARWFASRLGTSTSVCRLLQGHPLTFGKTVYTYAGAAAKQNSKMIDR